MIHRGVRHYDGCARLDKNGMLLTCLGLRRAVGLVLLAISFSAQALAALEAAAPPARPDHQKRANFKHSNASQDARQIADWVVDSNDNRSLPFVIVDKKEAKVFVFYADGRLRGAAAALLGSAVGDDSVPGIGDRQLSSIRPEERTTPAGRFVAALDRNLHGKTMLWVDYDAAISMHPVITSNVQERRAQRLATPTPDDNRISYGCINVPLGFFNKVIGPAFNRTNGIVYVLPETRESRQVFALYASYEQVRLTLAVKADATQ